MAKKSAVKKSKAKKTKKSAARKKAAKKVAAKKTMAKKVKVKKAARKKTAAKKSAAKKKKSGVARKGTVRKKPVPIEPATEPNHIPASVPALNPLIPPPGGAAVRMYRIGHGDCFLIAFASDDPEKPVYVLIDCGYKPGSPGMLKEPTNAKVIGEHIIATTGGFVHVAVVTHEHQDHVNAITDNNFSGLKVGKVWFAWTENPHDDVANALRTKFRDRLLGLIDSRASLLGAGKSKEGEYLDFYLESELGEEADQFNGKSHAAASGKDPAKSANKIAMKYLRDCSQEAPEYLYPHGKARAVPGAKNARAFVLGPPRDISKIDDLDPKGDENFGHGMGAAAAGSQPGGQPFPARHAIPLGQAFKDGRTKEFLTRYYGQEPVPEVEDGRQIPDNAEWRRLTADDAADAGALALAMSNATNNASLVLAFELGKSGKVLLFVGDAQAGNWRSWSDDVFDDDGAKVTAEDLLGRTVLYKVGHHGSHNATLKGKAAPGRASLAGMALGRHASEFVAMITAVEAWAHQKPKPDWNHPLPAIKQALVEKAGGRVLQTDASLPANPTGAGAADWQAFIGRVTETPLYFDLKIEA